MLKRYRLSLWRIDMERNLTCIACPLGCNLIVTIENNKVIKVVGNTCKRGEAYAKDECTNPKRTITTIVRSADNVMVPVKSLYPIDKDKVLEAIKIINKVRPTLPIKVGDVILEEVYNSPIVATANVTKE